MGVMKPVHKSRTLGPSYSEVGKGYRPKAKAQPQIMSALQRNAPVILTWCAMRLATRRAPLRATICRSGGEERKADEP
jgi:hypothetical protein